MVYANIMCGRFASYLPPKAIRALFGTRNPLPNVAASWNVAPSQQAMVVRRHPETGERHLDLLAWGLVPHWTKDLNSARRPINARAETVNKSPMFRSAYASRRAIIPCQAFYEWQMGKDGRKHPFAVAGRDVETLALAGIWEGWKAENDEVLRTFAIITTTANTMMAPVHDRMPVILEALDWPAWLGEVENGDVSALLRPASNDVLRVWPVSTALNAPRHNGPELLEPAPL